VCRRGPLDRRVVERVLISMLLVLHGIAPCRRVMIECKTTPAMATVVHRS